MHEDGRRWVRFDDCKQITGVDIYDSYICVKNTKWIMNKMNQRNQTVISPFFMHFTRCYVDFEVLESTIHHYQTMNNSNQKIELHFDGCTYRYPFQNLGKYNIQNISKLFFSTKSVIDFNDMEFMDICIATLMNANKQCLQYIELNSKIISSNVTNTLVDLHELRQLKIVCHPAELNNNFIQTMLQNNPDLEHCWIGGEDEIHKRNIKFIQSIINIMHMADQTKHAHNESIVDILLAFILPLLQFVPKWFPITYKDQSQLCIDIYNDYIKENGN